MYHHVSPSPGLVTVSPETFDAQMAHLKRAGYHALSAAEFLDLLKSRKPLSQRSVLITFDDGYLDNFVYAFPTMQRHGMRGIVFAAASWIGEGPVRARAGGSEPVPATPNHKACKAAIREGRADEVMMRWSEIRHAESAGILEIHSHTHSHVRWDEQIPDVTARVAAVSKDLQDSQAALKTHLGRTSLHLCWPWGHTEPGYSEAAQAAGFEVEYRVEKGINAPGTDPRQVSRIVVKDKAGGWFANRMRIFSNRLLGGLYTKLRGK